MNLNFEFLIPCKNVHVLNPYGNIALITLWTPPEIVIPLVEDIKEIAVVGSLFGGGLNLLLQNLLYNPQIEHLIVFGKELGEGSDHLHALYNRKIIVTNEEMKYKDNETNELIIDKKIYINGSKSKYFLTSEIIKHTKKLPGFMDFSTNGIQSIEKLRKMLIEKTMDFFESNPLQSKTRIKTKVLSPVVEDFPSNIFGHCIVQDTIFSAWKEVLFTLNKFGKMVQFRNDKTRKELHNLKVVINTPDLDLEETILQKHGFILEDLNGYGEQLLSSVIPEDQPYSYGNRITNYFGLNNIEQVITDMTIGGDRRRNYITLWDNKKDLLSSEGRPCLVSMFFRKINNKLHMVANFRSHNGAKAWPKNAYGLYYILKYICSNLKEITPGTLTIISHSISLDPNNINQITDYIEEYLDTHPVLKKDPNGYVKISVKLDKTLILQHFDHENNLLAEYEGKRPSEIQYELYRNKTISDIGHAMYIGNQLEKAYICMLNDKEYIQDKKTIKFT